jgi:condensin complex subunit 1
VSFSNIIDENSNELYKGLSDPNLVVKKNTLMVLTHLILNGMIKVKGQLGEMAKCIEDPDTRISDLAKLFFKDLSTKDNAIYNNLPDGMSPSSVFTNLMLIWPQSSATLESESMPWTRRHSSEH